MRYDIDEILRKMYSNQNEVKPSYALNHKTLEKMKECCEMDKKKSKIRLNKFMKLAITCCCMCLLVGISVPAYDAIKAYKWKASISFEDSSGETKKDVQIGEDVPCKKIPDNFPKKEQLEEVSIKEIEELLGFSILDSERNSDEKVGYTTLLNEDGTIGRVDITRMNYIECGGWNSICMIVSILNEGADLGYALGFEQDAGDPMGGKEHIANMYLENIDANAVLYRAGGIGDVKGDVNAMFEYDDMLYHIRGLGISEKEMVDYLNNLK